jgi:hypothetical protein
MWYISQKEAGMSKHVTFEVSAWSEATPQAVYDLLRDGASWPRWSPIGSFALEREGGAGGAGGESLGAIRAFKTGPVTSREELVLLEPGRAFSYAALSGMPIHSHRADVKLTERDGGTAITWREDFVVKWFAGAWFIRRSLRGFVQRCADGLAAHAAGVAGPVSYPPRP